VRARCFGASSSALDERLVDDYLGRDMRQFAPLAGLHLLSHGREVPLHPVDADRNAVDQGKRFPVFGKPRNFHRNRTHPGLSRWPGLLPVTDWVGVFAFGPLSHETDPTPPSLCTFKKSVPDS
jgi:hypothetical protein